MQDMQVCSLDGKDPLEEEMATHSSILAWKIPWTEEPGGLSFMGSQKGQAQLITHTHVYIKQNHFAVHPKLTHCKSIVLQ